MPKILMMIGVIVFLLGLIAHFIPLGKLPGDILIKRENTTIYIPIVTMIILSILLSAISYFVGRFK